jgi:DNA-binding CsgD family transcriptional regulator
VFGDAASGFASVCVQAGRGQWDTAAAQIDILDRMNQALGAPATEDIFLALARATLAQARADHAAMLGALEPMFAPASEGAEGAEDSEGAEGKGTGGAEGADDRIRLRFKPFWLWQQSLLVEALTGVGRLGAAARALDDLTAGYDGEGYLQVVVARLAGQLAEAQGRPQDALATYERAVAETPADGGDAAPLFRAMLEHSYGRLLAATGSRREAVRWFASARDRFGALRAAPFLERCDADLAAIGLAAPGQPHSHVLTLTERELAVAFLIIAGRTNQEAAAELYVTPKTVEYHLSNVYAKLGISSRRQLGEALQTSRA